MNEAHVAITAPEAPAIVKLPARVRVQIGLRKRYFNTREAALEALTAFNARGEAKAIKAGGMKRTRLTPEQKVQVAAARVVLFGFAGK